ncbi:MAG: excalibur calcium-binding domain-containing protein [Stenotrophomonas sp.]
MILLVCSLFPVTGHTHPGGLNKDGCHTNRSTGDYHCHRGSASPAPRSNFNAAPTQAPAPARIAPAGSAGGHRVFANCTEARAAGAAPVRRGDPGYGSHLDRDNDGIGCEPYR